MSKVKYDNYQICDKCGGQNNLTYPIYDGYCISEANTKCIKCGYEAFWAYGFYESVETTEDDH